MILSWKETKGTVFSVTELHAKPIFVPVVGKNSLGYTMWSLSFVMKSTTYSKRTIKSVTSLMFTDIFAERNSNLN